MSSTRGHRAGQCAPEVPRTRIRARGDLQEGNGCASRCQLPLSLVPIPVFPSTKLAFLCAFASKFFPMVVRRGSMLVVSSRWRPLMMTLAHSPAYRRSDQQYLCRGAQKCHKASSGRACWQRLTKTRTKKPCKRSRTQKSRVQEAAHKEAVYKKSGTKKSVHKENCARRRVCSRRESNPYGHFCPQDFKSCVSTYSTTRAVQI